MTTGTVKWFNPAKGYGFLVDDTGTDVYVHVTGLDSELDGLNPDDVVEFDVEDGDHGVQAVRVTLVRAAEPAQPTPTSGDRPVKARSDLVAAIEETVRQLESSAAILRQRGTLGPTAAFNSARALRRLANRLNPPAA